ncbi:MAG: hypothetical protein JW790_04810 [Dehalococcoidales bacterium]|nr:hypothetical protein [Dehalococcoidales bacterium]
MAIETLRPNAAGDEENINWASSGAGHHHEDVDEVTPDDSATQVGEGMVSAYCRDLYNIDNHSAGSGIINQVTVYARCRCSVTPSLATLKLAIKAGEGAAAPDTVAESSEMTATLDWAIYSKQWPTNPKTGSAWTWDEIDNLQVGITAKRPQYGEATYITQVYLEVDYTAITEKASADSGAGSEAKTSGNPFASLSKADSGSAAEGTPAQEASLTGSETGSGLELILSLLGKLAAEAGSGVEDSYVAIINCARESYDGGAGGDLSTLTAELSRYEAGSAVESLLSRLIHHGDSGGASDGPVTLCVVLSGTETGAGAEALLGRLIAVAEVALGGDGLPSRNIGLIDAGSGAELSAIYKMLIASDGGSGFEALSGLIVLIPAGELGRGRERLGAKIMTAPGAADTKLPTNIGKAEIPRH